jgi:hypothetical protein
MIPSSRISTNNFRISVEDGTTQAELMDMLASNFPGSPIAVVPDTTVADVTEDEVISSISGNLLSAMTLEQRARAIEAVKREFVMPDVVYGIINDIISDNWTDIVFGLEDE